jgi:hypothetical protein
VEEGDCRNKAKHVPPVIVLYGVERLQNMAPARRKQEGLLARVNFPLYTVQMLTSRHVLVGGGGGSSNTGVANGFVSNKFEVKKSMLLFTVSDFANEN